MIGIDIDMPDNCWECPLRRENVCAIDPRDPGDLLEASTEIPYWCPLVEFRQYVSPDCGIVWDIV